MVCTKFDVEDYFENMEFTESDILDTVMSLMDFYDPNSYTDDDVINALRKDYLDIQDMAALLSPAAEKRIEEMANRAKIETSNHFGNSVNMFTPIYVSNYCTNQCVYCGFNCKNKIQRAKLELKDVESAMIAIAKTGLTEILILTGESRELSDVDYIGECVKIAAKHFQSIGVEIYPLNTEEYRYLNKCGADYVTVFQENIIP